MSLINLFCLFSLQYISVKEKLTADPDSEIATTSLRVSLLCPVSVCLCLPLKMVYTLDLCNEHENSAYF